MTVVKTVWNLMGELRNFTFYFYFILQVQENGVQWAMNRTQIAVSSSFSVCDFSSDTISRIFPLLIQPIVPFPINVRAIPRCTVKQQSYSESPIPYMYAVNRSHVPGV
jgi:hypothetical protein